MAQVKCTECNQIFDDTLNECPNCGCPSSECKPLRTNTIETNGITTDTGYKYEKQLIYYTNFLYGLTLVVGALMSVLSVISLSSSGVSGFFAGLLLGILIFVLFWVIATISRAFLMILPNISINIHEINMKLK